MNTSHIEILAPAGSFASLRATLGAGADAIYFGIADFNMRATASVNFAPEDLKKLSQLCSEKGVKTYMTVNTLMYDEDLPTMKKVVQLAKQHHITAIIASDQATIAYAREHGVEVHISTQISVSNIETVKFYSQFADRMVLARELRLEQVTNIVEQIKAEDIRGPKGDLVEIEVFAHGALCVAVSGRCAMSLFHYNTSANRGRCAQVCRHQFTVTDQNTGKKLKIDNNFIMSSADLCTIGMLDKLVASGVICLKFEGRGRPPEYVEKVISTYKKALQSIDEDTYTQEKIEQWNKDLGTVFNRGFSENFYMGRKVNEWSHGAGSQATTTKIELGIVEKYYPKIKVVQIKIRTPETITINDNLIITSEKTGLVKTQIKEMMIDDKKVKIATKGDEVTFLLDEKVHKNDMVYVVRSNKS